MTKVYKIHPAIGIARVGNHTSSFFVGPEAPGKPAIEFDRGGNEIPLTSYKQNGLIKRQAARFRVYEYEQQTDGSLQLIREVTTDESDHPVIHWRVDLVNSKAAGNRILEDNPEPRNESITNRQELIIRNPAPETIAGVNQSGVLFDQGKFRGKAVYLGELKTDGQGRLLVFGGRGVSDSVPANEPITDFANNDFWHDDVSDGPVTATIKIPGQPDRAVDAPAWVVVAPPDFAPGVGAIVTLFDVAFQAALQNPLFQVSAPAVPSFRQHVFPVLERTSNHRWVHKWNPWNGLSRDWELLSKKSDPASMPLRLAWFNRLVSPGLSAFEMPAFLETLLQKWRDGNFHDDWAAPTSPITVTPANLDRAALEACTGANFFPGIEASHNMKNVAIYAEPFRLSHQSVKAGDISQIMAVPWQADFLKCRISWWPSQRPDQVYVNPADAGVHPVSWSSGADGSHVQLVKNFGRLGVVVPQATDGETMHLEADRDATLPPR
jgi:hypothetical protein